MLRRPVGPGLVPGRRGTSPRPTFGSAPVQLFMAGVALCLAGCGEPTWSPYSLVDKLRVLGVASEPAAVHPGELARLKALVVDPNRPGKKDTILWISCDPDPTSVQVNACTQFETLRNPGDFLSGCLADGCPQKDQRCDMETQSCVPGCSRTGCETGMRCETMTQTCIAEKSGVAVGIRPAGINEFAAYQAPADIFAPLPADDPHRVRGLVATIFGIVFGDELPFPPEVEDIRGAVRRADAGEIESVLFLKRLPIVDNGVAANKNPRVTAILLFGAGLPEGGGRFAPGSLIPRFQPGEKVEINATAEPGAAECYAAKTPQGEDIVEDDCDGDGVPDAKKERLIAVWFTTAGAFENDRTAIDYTVNHFTAPDGSEKHPIPDDRTGRLWTVLQDGRGGTSWIERSFYVCDAALPSPAIESVDPNPVSIGQTVTLRGQSLDQVLDVGLSDLPVWGGWDSQKGAWVGSVISGTPTGNAIDLVARGRNCRDDHRTVEVR